MKRLRNNFLYSFSYQLLLMIIPLITTPYVSRVLGPQGIGEYSYAYSVAYYFVLFLMLGVTNYGNRTIAQSRDNYMLMSKNFINIYALQIIMGCIASICYIIYCFSLSNHLEISILLGMYVLSGMFDVTWFFDGLELFKLTVLRNASVKLLGAVSIFLFVKTRTDVATYCGIMAASFLLSQMLLWPYVLTHVHFEKPVSKEIRRHIKPNLVLFISVIAISLYKVLDKLMLGILSSMVQVGFFESSEKIINIPTAAISALGAVMLPYMSNKVTKNAKNNQGIIRATLLIAVIGTSALCFGIMSVSKQFIPLFYGAGFEACEPLFLILLPSCLFLAYANVVRTQFLLPYRMDKIYVKSTFLGALVNVSANLLLISKLQSVGTAIGTLLAEATVCVIQCEAVRHYLNFVDYLTDIMPPLVAGMVMFLLNYFVLFPNESGWKILIFKIIIGALVYLIVLAGLMFMRRKKYIWFKEVVGEQRH